jgi:hypothetical protein
MIGARQRQSARRQIVAGKLVSHDSLSQAIRELEHVKLSEPTSLEATGPSVSDAELRAYLADAMDVLEAETGPPGVMVTTQHQLASLLQTYLLEHPGGLVLREEPAPNDAREVMYDEGDVLGWARSLLDWWRKIKPEPWIDPPARPEPVGDGSRLRIAVMGDWGTGLYGAPVIAATINADPDGFDLLVHLGDVYYSGTPKEVERNFKAHWPKSAGKVSRAVNSNHEMYSGGEGLYKVTMPWFGQQATCWAAQNDYWLLVGLDSAYSDHDFAHGQPAWLAGLVREKGERRVLLFCHHQPYSLLDKQGPKLVAKLGGLLDSGHIFGWYWGHEHRCVIHEPHPVWKVRGRCIGHGGFPAYRDDLDDYPRDGDGAIWRRLPGRNLVPGGRVLDMPNEYIPSAPDRYGANGYVTLEMEGPALVERVHAPDGDILLEEALA